MDIPSLAPQWIKRTGSSLNSGAPSKLGVGPESQQQGAQDHHHLEQRGGANVSSGRPQQQQLRPAHSIPWANSKPSQSRAAPPAAGPESLRSSQAAERRTGAPVRAQLQDLLTAADPLSNRVLEVYRTSSVPPPNSVPFQNGGHTATFESEFPSLRDTAPASVVHAQESTQPSEPLPSTSKQVPYRPSYLAERVNTNWTSKLADAPSPPPYVEPPAPAPEPPAPAATTHSIQPAAQPEAVAPPAPIAQATGWVSLANGSSGDGGRSKLLDTLSGTAASTSQQGAVQDAGTFRAQLAVRQSKQLIPVLARKDKPGEGGGSSGSTTKATPAAPMPGRTTLMGTVAMLRQASSGADRAAAPTNGQAGVGADGKLQLRPLARKPAAAAAEEAAPARVANGMVALRKSPPPPSRKLSDAALLSSPAAEHVGNGVSRPRPVSPTSSAPAQRAAAEPPKQQPDNNRPATPPDAASQTTASAGVQGAAHAWSAVAGAGRSSVESPLQGAAVDQDWEHGATASALQAAAMQEPTPPQPAPLEPPAAPRTNAHAADTTGSRADTTRGAAAAGPVTRISQGQSKVPDFTVPPDEYAFLVSLGWSGEEEEDDGEGDALTDEEIAAFKAASAHIASAPSSRTTSPAPYVLQASSPGNSRQQRAVLAGKAGAGGGCHDATVLCEVEPLFPGVSPGWFGGQAP